jgi:hypothetical protein
MQKLQFALFQMDEAKRYLNDGSVPALRVALMLLDNAAEVLIDRWIVQDLALDSMMERLQRRVRKDGIPNNHSDFSDLLHRQFLSKDEKKRVGRYFDEKIRYVTESKSQLSMSVGAVLSHLHRYRNEAYHSGHVKTETLRTSVMILLELCCQLVMSLKPGASYSSDEDFSWLKRRFDVTPHHLWDDKRLASLVSVFRDGLPIDDSSIRDTLAENLERRISDVDDALDFISGESRVDVDRSGALRDAQKYALEKIKVEPPYKNLPKNLDAPLSLDHLQELKSFPDRIRSASDSLAGFEIYAEADIPLERIEFVVSQLAGSIEEAIQFEIDRARGK